MIRRILVTIFLLTILPLTSGCEFGEKNSQWNLPGIDIPIDSMNKRIQIIDDPVYANTYENNKIISLVVENKTKQDVIFPKDYGIKIFSKVGENWVRVDNKMNYSTLEKILPSNIEFPAGISLPIVVQVPFLSTSTTIRVIVIGHFKDQPSEQVASYIDLPLYP